MLRIVLIGVCLSAMAPGMCRADVGGKVLREALEYATRKFGKEMAEEGAERVASRVGSLAARHGDDLVSAAIRNAGPQAGRLAAEAGEHGGSVLRVLARHGSDGAAALSRPGAMSLVGRYGDDAAEALVRHGKVGEEVIETFGETGAKALSQVTEQNGRRLAMLAKDGTLEPELLDVVRQHGDSACDFIWKNKGALAVGATLTTFVTSPTEFLDGSAKLATVVGDAAVRPIAEIPKVVLAETLDSVTGVIGVLVLGLGGIGLWLVWNPNRRRWVLRLLRGGSLMYRVSKLTTPSAVKGA